MKYLLRAWALYLIVIGAVNVLAWSYPNPDGWALFWGVIDLALGAWTWHDSKTASKALRPWRWEVNERVMDGWVTRETGRAFTSKGADRAIARAEQRVVESATKGWTMTKGGVK